MSSADEPEIPTKEFTQTGTSVDLGEDLLESTNTQSPIQTKPEILDHQIEDQYESARILANEGLVEEAKKVLRRIILLDPAHVAARKKLQEIQSQEMKNIFQETEE